ncbi:MAG: tetratricopeptide repeat protein [Planctomycetaceae bacterium]|nr:tetratricopeptide repeat protein [Planctomycetaceae bacterium]
MPCFRCLTAVRLKTLRNVLAVAFGIEIIVVAFVVGRRLNSTHIVPPHAEQYHDSLTSRELLDLPDRYWFDSTEKWRELAEVYMTLGHFAKADACLGRAMEGNPLSTSIAFSRAYCLERLGRIDDANAVLHRVAEQITGQSAQTAWYCIGCNALKLEQAAEAAHAFERAGIDHLPSLYQRARLLVRGAQAAQAEPLLTKLVAEHPRDPRVLQLRSAAAAALGRSEEADGFRDAVDRALVSLSVDAPPFDLHSRKDRFGLGREMAAVYEQLQARKFDAVSRRLPLLVSEDMHGENHHPLLLQKAAEYLVYARNEPVARLLLDRQIDEYGFPTARAWELRGDVLFHDHQPDAAWSAWSHALRMQPETIDYPKLAEAAQQAGDQLQSRRYLSLADQYAGMQHLRNDRLEPAHQALQRAAARDPELADVWFYLGETERLLGNGREAEVSYRRCLKLVPWHGRAQSRLDRLSSTRRGPPD